MVLVGPFHERLCLISEISLIFIIIKVSILISLFGTFSFWQLISPIFTGFLLQIVDLIKSYLAIYRGPKFKSFITIQYFSSRWAGQDYWQFLKMTHTLSGFAFFVCVLCTQWCQFLLDCPFLMVPSVFSSVYLQIKVLQCIFSKIKSYSKLFKYLLFDWDIRFIQKF